MSSEPSVQNVDFIKDIKEIKTRKVWLQICTFSFKHRFLAFQEHKETNHGKERGVKHSHPQCQQKEEEVYQGIKHKINTFIILSLQDQIAFYNTFPTMTDRFTDQSVFDKYRL